MNRFIFQLISTFIVIGNLGAQAQQKQVVRVTPGFATVIVCPVPPDLVTVGNMDAYSVQSAGNYILIKPLTNSGTTNMFIKAGSESFNLLIQIVPNKPDLEVRLTSSQSRLPPVLESKPSLNDKKYENKELTDKRGAEVRRQSLSSLSPKALSLLAGLFKSDKRYTYSVTNSNVVFAIDHMKQIKDKLFIIGTIVNNSNIPYDVGFVRFKMIDYARNYLFWRKKVKETDLEPTNEYYNATIAAHSFGRLLFIFDKQGFSNQSTINIKCDEENGRRDLVIEVPGSVVE